MDTLFFYVSKLTWLFLSPDSLLLILIVFSLILLYLGKTRLAKTTLTTTSLLLILISLFPIGEWLLFPLESHFQTNPALPEKIDGIIVLSGAENAELSSIWKQIELNAAVERDLTFIQLAERYPTAKLIFTGGSGSLTKQEFKGADVAEKLFRQLDLDAKKITFERESRNTYENIIFSKNIIKPNKNENWILITTGWHMPRSVGISCKSGWPVIPFPVDHQTKKDDLFRIDFDLSKNLKTLKTGMKEWMGLFAYYLSRKTTAFFPKQCK